MPANPLVDETWLQAGPPPANPPLFLAALIIGISLTAPVLFSMAGAPSLLLAIAAFALAAAGIIALISAISAQRKRRGDATIRRRARISAAGIAFHRQAEPCEPELFAREHIRRVFLAGGALIVDTTPDHPNPGRHRLHFGKLATPRGELAAAIASFNEPANANAPL